MMFPSNHWGESYLPEAELLKEKGYLLGYTIGFGAFAKVKDAYSVAHKRKVAIKIINLKKAPEDFKEKFLPRELEICEGLIHRYIIQIHQIIKLEHKLYIVMDYADHGNLMELVKMRGSLPETQARHLFSQILSAIDYLHRNGIVHRDMKCENVLLNIKNNVKLTDFGFARYYILTDMSRTYCGSTAYAPPEVIKGVPYKPVNHDIWATGVILFIMVCAKMPYEETNVRIMVNQQEANKLTFSKTIPAECEDLIRCILDVNLRSRFKMSDILKHSWIVGSKMKK